MGRTKLRPTRSLRLTDVQPVPPSLLFVVGSSHDMAQLHHTSCLSPIKENLCHPLASHPEVPTLTDLQVLIAEAILSHGEPCPFNHIVQHVVQRLHALGGAVLDACTDMRRVVLQVLVPKSDTLSLFRKDYERGQSSWRCCHTIQEAKAKQESNKNGIHVMKPFARALSEAIVHLGNSASLNELERHLRSQWLTLRQHVSPSDANDLRKAVIRCLTARRSTQALFSRNPEMRSQWILADENPLLALLDDDSDGNDGGDDDSPRQSSAAGARRGHHRASMMMDESDDVNDDEVASATSSSGSRRGRTSRTRSPYGGGTRDRAQPSLTQLQVVMAECIDVNGGEATFPQMLRHVSRYWGKLRRRDGSPYTADARRAIKASLANNPVSHPVFFVAGHVEGEKIWGNADRAVKALASHRSGVSTAAASAESSFRIITASAKPGVALGGPLAHSAAASSGAAAAASSSDSRRSRRRRRSSARARSSYGDGTSGGDDGDGDGDTSDDGSSQRRSRNKRSSTRRRSSSASSSSSTAMNIGNLLGSRMTDLQRLIRGAIESHGGEASFRTIVDAVRDQWDQLKRRDGGATATDPFRSIKASLASSSSSTGRLFERTDEVDVWRLNPAMTHSDNASPTASQSANEDEDENDEEDDEDEEEGNDDKAIGDASGIKAEAEPDADDMSSSSASSSSRSSRSSSRSRRVRRRSSSTTASSSARKRSTDDYTPIQAILIRVLTAYGGSATFDDILVPIRRNWSKLRRRDGSSYSSDISRATKASLAAASSAFRRDAKGSDLWHIDDTELQKRVLCDWDEYWKPLNFDLHDMAIDDAVLREICGDDYAKREQGLQQVEDGAADPSQSPDGARGDGEAEQASVKGEHEGDAVVVGGEGASGAEPVGEGAPAEPLHAVAMVTTAATPIQSPTVTTNDAQPDTRVDPTHETNAAGVAAAVDTAAAAPVKMEETTLDQSSTAPTGGGDASATSFVAGGGGVNGASNKLETTTMEDNERLEAERVLQSAGDDGHVADDVEATQGGGGGGGGDGGDDAVGDKRVGDVPDDTSRKAKRRR